MEIGNDKPHIYTSQTRKILKQFNVVNTEHSCRTTKQVRRHTEWYAPYTHTQIIYFKFSHNPHTKHKLSHY